MLIVSGWWNARWSAGVRRLVMHGVLPARVPDRVIAEIRWRERAGLVELPKPRLGPGMGVRVISGPLSDQIGLLGALGESFYNYGANGTNGPFQGGAAGASNPQGNGAGFKDRSDGGDFIMRTRAYAWFDSRQQTEYGTLRSYLQIGVNYDSPNSEGA